MKLFEKLAKSAGAGFADKFNQTAEQEIYQFQCSKNHTFFIQVDLPQSVNEVTDLFKKLSCPVCLDRQIKIMKTL